MKRFHWNSCLEDDTAQRATFSGSMLPVWPESTYLSVPFNKMGIQRFSWRRVVVPCVLFCSSSWVADNATLTLNIAYYLSHFCSKVKGFLFICFWFVFACLFVLECVFCFLGGVFDRNVGMMQSSEGKSYLILCKLNSLAYSWDHFYLQMNLRGRVVLYPDCHVWVLYLLTYSSNSHFLSAN